MAVALATRTRRAPDLGPFARVRRRSTATLTFERAFWKQGYRFVAGVDEVGRGPLAGPVVAGAVVWPATIRAPWLKHIADSKVLTAEQREWLFTRITASCVAWAVGVVDVDRIDRINILNATKEAMGLAIRGLSQEPDLLLLDALTLPEFSVPQTGLIDGDALSTTIAAASILAKVTRDRFMIQAAQLYPEYGFDRHKGYSCREHFDALRCHGPTPLHRRSFEPVRLAEQGQLAEAWFAQAFEDPEASL